MAPMENHGQNPQNLMDSMGADFFLDPRAICLSDSDMFGKPMMGGGCCLDSYLEGEQKDQKI